MFSKLKLLSDIGEHISLSHDCKTKARSLYTDKWKNISTIENIFCLMRVLLKIAKLLTKLNEPRTAGSKAIYFRNVHPLFIRDAPSLSANQSRIADSYRAACGYCREHARCTLLSAVRSLHRCSSNGRGIYLPAVSNMPY